MLNVNNTETKAISWVLKTDLKINKCNLINIYLLYFWVDFCTMFEYALQKTDRN